MSKKKILLLLQPYQSESGVALIIVFAVIIPLTILASIGFELSTRDRQRIVALKETFKALQFAESAVEDVRARMLPGYDLAATTSALSIGGTINTTAGLTGNECQVTITRTGSDMYKIGATYPATGAALRKVEVIATAEYQSVFRHAACGCTSFEINGATDSYNSADGNYASQTPGNNGDIASNGDIVLKGLVDGDLLATGDIDSASTSSGVVTGNAHLGGLKADGLNCGGWNSCIMGTLLTNLIPAPAPCDCSSVDVDTMAATAAVTNDNALLPAPYTGTTNLDLEGESLTITSSGTYYFTSIDLREGASISVATTAPVTIVLAGPGPHDFGGDGLSNSSSNASNLRIYSNHTGIISFRGGSGLSAVVYAPKATLRLNGNFDAYGAFLGNSFYGNGTSNIHYDEAAGDINMSITNYKITSWREDKDI